MMIGASSWGAGESSMNYGIIVAAGKSERMQADVDKAFLSLGPKPVLAYSLQAFEECPDIDEVILVVRKKRVAGARAMARMFGCAKVTQVIAGGNKRQTSVINGLECMGPEARFVTVHDGARPCVSPKLISETVRVARRYGSAVAAKRITDTVKYVEAGLTVTRTLDRSKLWAVQTPQTFRVDLLKKAYEAVTQKDLTVTDEASAVELLPEDVHLVEAMEPNIKITTGEDLPVAAALLKLDPANFSL
jgi:2-C-methyl-D-erythritol 4-phosphate cytidylyltransferase